MKRVWFIYFVLILPLTAQQVVEETIDWDVVDGAKGYRIEVQKAEGETVFEKEVAENKISLSLPEGRYRLRVAAINKFRRTSSWSEWEDLELKFIPPRSETASIRPENQTVERKPAGNETAASQPENSSVERKPAENTAAQNTTAMNETAVTEQPVVNDGAFFRSLIFPGLGQLKRGERGKGYFYLAAAGGTALFAVVSYRNLLSAQQEYNNSTIPAALNLVSFPAGYFLSQNYLSTLHDRAEGYSRSTNLSILAYLCIWGYNLYDIRQPRSIEPGHVSIRWSSFNERSISFGPSRRDEISISLQF